ncbi:Phosphatase 2C family protein isoform 1 [Hibiscus syriacus]|uniref:Phosphatase 2C family protein isoform 1 n=1 Tax=Hibiscus syriacus TaxID=106335 RepID=A0A6A3AEP9_HIBSY|nr:non-specific lipid-transfer protein 13-like [Hibiscus syriacus]KAE8703081.1 Phosphatase 2C family protein isoform 1 [Hibiscus syriacus]
MSRLISCIIIFLLIIGSAAGRKPNYCSRVTDHFFPCITYLVGFESRPADGCCGGLEELNQLVRHNGKGPKSICQCIEDLDYVMNVPFIASRIQSLPDECRTHVSFPVSVAMKCSG